LRVPFAWSRIKIQDLIMPKKASRAIRVPPAQHELLLKITLKYIRPPIWRRVIVPDNLTLSDLHSVIQIVMGWTNSHLHAFKIGLLEFGMPDEDGTVEPSVADEDSVLLRHAIARKGLKFAYEYDFGDGWLHEIRVEKVKPASAPHPRPACLAGQRACPPEDCGGVPGYENVLRVLKRAATKDDRQLRDWVGDYQPEQFDAEAVNDFLKT